MAFTDSLVGVGRVRGHRLPEEETTRAVDAQARKIRLRCDQLIVALEQAVLHVVRIHR
jgi:hypothetical protein